MPLWNSTTDIISQLLGISFPSAARMAKTLWALLSSGGLCPGIWMMAGHWK
nr:MAG TPA: MCo-PMI, E3 ubiquitin-protein ligase Mdm2 oncoprotein, MCoTI-I cyclotide, p53 [Caudoviricetes sp.]